MKERARARVDLKREMHESVEHDGASHAGERLSADANKTTDTLQHTGITKVAGPNFITRDCCEDLWSPFAIETKGRHGAWNATERRSGTWWEGVVVQVLKESLHTGTMKANR